jgi:hypothetical protein
MASRIMHLAISERVAEHFGLDLMRFNLGNLLPDLHENTKEAKAISHFRIKREPYEDSKDPRYQYYDYEQFLRKYKNKIHDDLYLGYYCHLIADELWIQNVYIKYMRDENRKKRVNQENNYYHDYSRLNQIIKDKFNLKINLVFEESEISEIDSKRVSGLVDALEYDFNTRYDDLDLLLFDYGVIRAYIEESGPLIIKDLEQKNLR